MDQQLKSTPKDVFLHLFAILALYFNAFNFIQLIFQYIDVLLPDPLNPIYNPGGAIRWSLAALIVLYPVFVWAMRFLHKDIVAVPARADLRIRKWLVYLTLFLAGLLIIGDLIALISNFLEGDLTGRFLLKVLAILAVAASVFGYYLYDLRKSAGSFSGRAKIFVWCVSAVVAAAIIGGFFIAGSPFKQRLVRFDSQKVSHLQILQGQIVNYWQSKKKLPENLDDLRDSISGFAPPVDPQSGEPYSYRALGALAFELCAEFNLSSKEALIQVPRSAEPYPPGTFDIGGTWDHEAGRVCFDRTIDPEIYRPIDQTPRKF